MTRGRHANHVHAAPPAFDPDQHSPAEIDSDWTAASAVAAATERQPGEFSAIARRRELRGCETLTGEEQRSLDSDTTAVVDPVAAAMRRLGRLRRRPTQGLGR